MTAEQQEIVRRVESLFVLPNQIEAQLSTAQRESLRQSEHLFYSLLNQVVMTQ
jgi:hypothetical protein